VSNLEPTVKDALEKLMHYLLIVAITVTVLGIANVPLTVFTFVGGALAIGIGFGSQNILNNFISGLIILVEQPIRIHDTVELIEKRENMIGKVINIGARCINLRTANNIDILVPNSVMLQNTVINWTLNNGKVKCYTTIPVNLNQEISSREVAKILLESVSLNSSILKKPSPAVLLAGFDDSIMKFEINYYIDITDPGIDRKLVLSEVNHQAREALTKHNIRLSSD
jgi:small-conductance mechanosensitive channel